MKKAKQIVVTSIEGPVDERTCPKHGRELAYVLRGKEVEVYEDEDASTSSAVGWTPALDANWAETFGVCDVVDENAN